MKTPLSSGKSGARDPERSRSRLLPLARATRQGESDFESRDSTTASDSLFGSDGEDSALLRKLNQARSASAIKDVEVA